MEMTPNGLLVPNGTITTKQEDPKRALERYYEGMAKMEHTFPSLVKNAIAVGNFIESMATQKGIKPEGVILDVARWHRDGRITIAVEFDAEAKRDATNDLAVKNFSTLKEVNESYPQAVELAMSLAYQLVGVVNNKKIMPNQIKASSLKWSAAGSVLSFRMTHNGSSLRPPIEVRI